MAGKTTETQRRIDAAAKLRFLEGLRAGAPVKKAALQAGFSAEAFYCARKRDPLLKLAWMAVVELSTEEARQRARTSSLVALVDGVEIAPNNKRGLQKRRVRATRFTPARQQTFLDVFAATADFKAAAEAAGVSESTVYKLLARNPEFARRRDAARALAITRLEDEAVRGQLAAQAQLRDAASPEGEIGLGFERTMKLLAHHQRRADGVGACGPGGQQRADFWGFIAAADAKLRALGARHGINAEPILPPHRTSDVGPDGETE